MQQYNFLSMTKKEYNQRNHELNTLKSFYKGYKNISSQQRKEILDKIKQVKNILKSANPSH